MKKIRWKKAKKKGKGVLFTRTRGSICNPVAVQESRWAGFVDNWFDLIWFGFGFGFGLIWFDLVWFDLIWFGLIFVLFSWTKLVRNFGILSWLFDYGWDIWCQICHKMLFTMRP